MAEWVAPDARRSAARRACSFQEARQLSHGRTPGALGGLPGPAADEQRGSWPHAPRRRRRQAPRARHAPQRPRPARCAGQVATSCPTAPCAAPPRPVAPTVVQAQPGATTTLISKPPAPPPHQQPGLPKIAATPGFVDQATLLPTARPAGRRGVATLAPRRRADAAAMSARPRRRPARRCQAPGLWRRLACFVYEGVLLFGVLMIAGLPLLAASPSSAMRCRARCGLQAFLFVVLGIYFVWFWSRGGQTVAMKTWHIRAASTATASRVTPGARAGALPAGLAVVRAGAGWRCGCAGCTAARPIGAVLLAGVIGYAAAGAAASASGSSGTTRCAARGWCDWQPGDAATGARGTRQNPRSMTQSAQGPHRHRPHRCAPPAIRSQGLRDGLPRRERVPPGVLARRA